MDPLEAIERHFDAERSGTFSKGLGSATGSSLPKIAGAANLASQMQQPRKFIGDQLAQANEIASMLLADISNLEDRLSSVCDKRDVGFSGSSQQNPACDPPHIEALDGILDRLQFARQLVLSITERVRV